MQQEINLSEIVRTLSLYVDSAAIDARVVEALIVDGRFLGKEHPLWDYKQKLDNDAWSYAKTVRHIVSLHNTYGGYLIFGVKNHEKDRLFEPIGIDENAIDCPRLRQEIRKYLGNNIDITYTEVNVKVADHDFRFGILHVPKRVNTKVLLFATDSPRNQDKKHLFKENEAYFRDGDICRAAQDSNDWHFLHSDRRYPGSLLDHPQSGAKSRYIPHNLPDRNAICPSFIGRTAIIKSLYQWLNDDFSYVKALVGDGGKGKTSIAYEFASELVSGAPCEFDIVVWLTAKQKQYSGIAGTYVSMPETHYSSVVELLQKICVELSFKEEEISDVPVSLLKRHSKEALTILHAFIVVDDVDSLDTEEQKEVLTTLLQIASPASKILVTTRANYSYASDQCIVVPGLSLDEYENYVRDLSSRYGVVIPKHKIHQLHETSAGSPLWTESIIRLVRQGENIGDAIDEWKGKYGEDARGAALSKELERLSPEGKRTLLAAAYFGSASLTELRQATGYGKQAIQEHIQELQSLFLLSSPRIIEEEPRFDISPLTRTTVIERKGSMAVDYTKLLGAVKQIRQGIDNLAIGGKKRLVGQAITQANALLKEGQFAQAVTTVESALNRVRDNPDLFLMLGICYDQWEPRRLVDARNLYKKAYDKGSRKELLFNRWYDAELASGHMVAAIEVSNMALHEKIGSEDVWQFRRAVGLVQSALSRAKDREYSSALADYQNASIAISKAITTSSGGIKQLRIQQSTEIHDAMWDVAMRLDTREKWSAGFDSCVGAIQRGDIRFTNYRRLVEALTGWLSTVDKGRIPASVEKGVLTRITRTQDLLKQRSADDKAASWYSHVKNSLDRLQDKFATITTT